MVKAFRLAALERAKRYVGVKENPTGSNHGRLIDQWCENTNGIPGGYPWCAAFLYCMFAGSGLDLKKQGLVGPALVENWVRWGRDKGYVVSRPLRGDVCCFDWGADGWRDHIGIVDRVLAVRWKGGRFVGWVRSCEGNTSGSSDSNGGEVQIRWRWVNGAQVYLRVPGP